MFSLNSNSCFTDSFDQNLTVFIENQTELIINTKTGESFATISGYARMSSLSKQAISKRCKNLVNQNQIKTAQVPTTQGLRTVNLIDENTIANWIIKDNPDLAPKLLKAGVRGYMHKLAGFEIKSTATDVELTPAEQLLKMAELMVQQERRQKELETKLTLEAERIDRHEKILVQHSAEINRVFNPDGDYYTIRGYASLLGIKLTVKEARVLGNQASNLSKELGIKTDKLPDPRYGRVGLYSESVLKIIFDENVTYQLPLDFKTLA